MPDDDDDDVRNIHYPEIRREDKHRPSEKWINKTIKIEEEKKGARNPFQRSIRVSFWFFFFFLSSSYYYLHFPKVWRARPILISDTDVCRRRRTLRPRRPTTPRSAPRGGNAVGGGERGGHTQKRANPEVLLAAPPSKGAAAYNIRSRAACVPSVNETRYDRV